MKKFLLSFFAVLLVAVYVVYSRLGLSSGISVNTEIQNPTPTATPSQNHRPNPNMMQSSMGVRMMGLYRDGEYIGKDTDTIFGKVQVAAVISGGKLVDVKFLHFPNDRPTSVNISNESLPILKTEAIAAQSAKVDIVSGATQTSEGFSESLAFALALAKK